MKKVKKILKIIAIIIVVLAIAIGLYLQHPLFGKSPTGERKERIIKSVNYKDGSFQNLEYTPRLTEGYSMLEAAYTLYFKGSDEQKNKEDIPHVETDLKNLPKDKNFYIWFGHSSYFMQIDGVKYLVDPVLSGSASPIPGNTKALKGSDYYKADMLPDDIDYLIITHDHYDHLDYDTIKKIKNKVKNVILPLGLGEDFEYWGYDKNKLTELDWYEEKQFENAKFTAVPARHSSGRLKTGQTLWSSYVLQTASKKIYLGGDSSYGKHFKDIGEKYGSFDLALIENGQYNKMWKYSHLFPEETLLVTKELNAKVLIPIHNSKFVLSTHAWNEPLKQLTAINKEKNYNINILTPKIGQVIDLNNLENEKTENWFE